MSLNLAALAQAANEARGLGMDAVEKAASGHLGLPLGCAELGATLFGHAFRYNPDKPEWLNRDIFVLSAGHGSMFLYAWLHLSGYKVSLDDIKQFRQLSSTTPGHPEFRDTPGVEATTGPLGQGVGNGLGYAVACKMAQAHFNTKDHKIFDQKVVVLAGDGCLQEGVAQEASALAGHLHLDNLIIFYDSNDVTLDAMAIESQSEDTAKRYEAYGFEVVTVKEGHNIERILEAYEHAKNSTSGKPQLIILKTTIAKGITEVAGTNKGHGEAGVKFVAAARKGLGLPEEKFFVSKGTRDYFQAHKEKLQKEYASWEKLYSEWRSANPELAALLDSAKVTPDASKLFSVIPKFADAPIATRKAGSDVLQPLAKALPLFISGSADLHGSTLNYIAGAGDYTPKNTGGRNIKFGIREHAMGAMLNGFAYHGIFRPSGATFLVFSDYLRPSIRLAALSHLPVIYIFTHDSVAVGEDGPTHQPVETVSSLRLIPNLDVIRPGDHEETAGAFVAALSRTTGPTLLALCRQNLPNLSQFDVNARREGVLKGGYILQKETGALKVIVISTGSELNVAVEAAKRLGDGVRVVSMPSTYRFDQQPAEYKEEVLPSSCKKRVVIEAGVTPLWHKYVGLEGKIIGIDRFGTSAPGATVLKTLGITADAVVAAANSF
uniref:Transketolase n=1 Tax=Physarum polycephalum TaxID=5791 RepID=TKT_PHYPO|nr:RecName: Full=Transketolase; Short=TK [Physarum polycephalum]ABQ23348.1 transketolase [Physarum polycephalum]|eukprot:Phypoly_transcript_01478.p1 GENE.Phypoly_transcript_01478~~Phypoly_transcript_01478.p1  ORF type:complete len:662 (-),score=103.54 Phypoly_transcript_01478:90-2075(-)